MKHFMHYYRALITQEVRVWADPELSQKDAEEEIREALVAGNSMVEDFARDTTLVMVPYDDPGDSNPEMDTCFTRDEGWIALEGATDENGDSLNPTTDWEDAEVLRPKTGTAFYQRMCEEGGQMRFTFPA